MISVSCVQMKPELGNFQANLLKMENFAEGIMAERPDTDLIVFPELITSGYECTKAEFSKLVEKIETGSESVDRMASICKKYGVTIVYGLPEEDPSISALFYNSMVMIGPGGDILGSYRKVHPFDTEKSWCRAGHDLDLVDTPFGKVGMMICWDTAFPEVARAYALKGADLLIVSTNWENPYSTDWDLWTRARAIDNTLHLVSSNRIGADRTLSFFGHSNVISPDGKVITSLDEESEGVIHAEIDLSLTAKLREEYYTMLKDRQPWCYSELTKPY